MTGTAPVATILPRKDRFETVGAPPEQLLSALRCLDDEGPRARMAADFDAAFATPTPGSFAMADQPLTKQQDKARKKGVAALGSAATTAFFTAMISYGFLIPGLPITAWLTYRWFKYRAEWGMKF
ncbi:MAG: hypothetical protein ABEN55_14290 [Bradymonadaceae bacterium]